MKAMTPIRTGRKLPEEFAALFREHAEFVFRTAYRVTGSAEDAEDVLQTLFVKLLSDSNSPEIQKSPKAYLYRAAVNTSLNVVRSRKRLVLTDKADDFEFRMSWQHSEHGDIREVLRIALAELNPKAAEIFVLRHVHGYSDVEIAKFLGTSRATIAVSLFRSRSRLRKSIQKLQGEKS